MGSANRAEMLAPQCCSRKTVALRRRPHTPRSTNLGHRPGIARGNLPSSRERSVERFHPTIEDYDETVR
jgi:hypothetical protein